MTSRGRGTSRTIPSALLVCLFLLAIGIGPAQAQGPAPLDPDLQLRLYHQALALWSRGDDVAALRTLDELRQRAGGLPRALLEVDEELGTRRPRARVAILGLQAWLHAWDISRVPIDGEGALREAGDLRTYLRASSESFLKLNGGPASDERRLSRQEARAVASRLWSYVGATLREDGHPLPALDFFLEAHALDPDNVGAAMYAGAILEKMGRYSDARERFEAVLEVEPRHHPARLRHALSVLRGGSARLGEELLAALAGSDAPRWIRVLAVTERAQSLASRGRRTEALDLALASREWAPEDEGLLLLQLWLSGDRSPASHTLLAELPDRLPADRELSPRAVYNHWPDDLEPILEAWRRDVDTHRPALREILPAGIR